MSGAYEQERINRECFTRLIALPVNDPLRPKLRDAVPYSAKVLDRMTRKYLSPGALRGKPQTVAWWNVTNPEPIYPAWTRSKVQAPCKPFESGSNVLPGLESFARENGII